VTITLPWPWRRRRDDEPAADETGRAEDEPLTDARFGGGDDEPAAWVTVYNAANLEEAHIVKGALEAADIPAVLRYESVSRLYATITLGGVDVQVPRTLADRARELVATGG
jgi:hypothetical protein